MAAIIPAKIRIETPFPIPFSVISSPNQTKNIDPAVMTISATALSKGVRASKIPWLSKSFIRAKPWISDNGIVNNLEY